MSGIKRRKDRSRLWSTRRLKVAHVYEKPVRGPSPLYIQLYLWEDLEAMRANSSAEKGMACHSPTPVRLRVGEDGSTTEIPRGLMSEIHFTCGEWNQEIVAHELMHAFFEAERSGVGVRFDELVDAPFEREEEWCYRFGRWFSQVYAWLWSEDPPLTVTVRGDKVSQ